MNQINITKIKEEFREKHHLFDKKKIAGEYIKHYRILPNDIDRFLETSVIKILDEIPVELEKFDDTKNFNHEIWIEGRNQSIKELKDIITKLKT